MKKLIIIILSLLLLTSCSIKETIDPNIYTGSVEGKEINLKSEVSGKIEEIYFIEGQKINELDTLIKINDTSLKTNLEKAKILKEISEITYQDLLNGVNQYDLKTQQNVINSINNQLNEAYNNQIYFKKQYDDNKKLFDSGSISKSKLDEIKLYLDNANSKIELLKQEKNAAINSYNKLETLITNETIDKAKKEIELRELDIIDIENNLKKTILTSPIDGIIQNINYSEGEIINQNSSLITIINQDKLFLNIYVAQKYLKDISIGKKVYFEDEFIGNKTYGQISFISDKAEFTPKNVESKENKQEMIFKIKIDIINPQNIKPGMYITVNLNGDYNE